MYVLPSVPQIFPKPDNVTQEPIIPINPSTSRAAPFFIGYELVNTERLVFVERKFLEWNATAAIDMYKITYVQYRRHVIENK